jgi:Mrp family chromosome partitioning ATPase
LKKLGRLVEDKRIIVCIGSGGVGKTTITSAIALEAASRGRRTLALTVDPSRRLAQSLGLNAGAASGKVSKRRMKEAGYSGKGELAVRLLCGPADYSVPPRCPRPSSGLVEQQRWFMKAPRRA